jgi:hypothetical protein
MSFLYWLAFNVAGVGLGISLHLVTFGHDVGVWSTILVFICSTLLFFINKGVPKLSEASKRLEAKANTKQLEPNTPSMFHVTDVSPAATRVLVKHEATISYSRDNGGVFTINLPEGVEIEDDLLSLPDGDLLRISHPRTYQKNKAGDVPTSNLGLLHDTEEAVHRR